MAKQPVVGRGVLTLVGVVAAAFVLLIVLLPRRDSNEQERGGGPRKSAQHQPGLTGITIPTGLSLSERRAAELARRVFVRACGITKGEWGLFSATKLQVRRAVGYRKDEFDWHTAVWITLVYKKGLKPGIGGHHLPFYLGAGNRPALVTSKPQAIEFCGLASKAREVRSGDPCVGDGSEDCILDLEELKALDADRPAAVVEAKKGEQAVSAYCFGHGFDPPEFWTCAETGRDCKKARKAKQRDENDDYRVRTKCKRTASAHCYVANGERTVCAPSPETCVRSRKEEWARTNATPCQIATVELVDAALKKDD